MAKLFLLFIATMILTMAISGCGSTQSLISNTVESINDLDYYLGNKDLKEAKPPTPVATVIPEENYLPEDNYVPAAIKTVEQSPLQSCLQSDDPRFSYRKKIAFTALTLDKPGQLVDLAQFNQRYPKALIRRFNREHFVIVDATHKQLPANYPNHLGGLTAIVRDLARELNVQFIVTGRVLDASFHNGSDTLYRQARKVMLLKNDERNRQLDIQLTIYDGATGQVVDESFYQGDAKDRLSMAHQDVLLTDRHLNNSYGQLADTFLTHQSYWLEETLTCLPMQARVTSVTGQGITFATGTEALLLPGDKLILLRRVQLPPSLSRKPGYRFELNGEVVVSQVYPNGAIAQFDGGTPPFQVNKGDIVQAW